MKKECKRVQKQLIAFHQNELSKERSDEIIKHLKSCKLCRNMNKDIESISKSINQVKMPKKPKAFWDKNSSEIMYKISELPETSPLTRFLSSFTFKANFSRAPRFAYSMTLVAIFFGIFSFNQYLQYSDLLHNMDMISNMDVLQEMQMYQNLEDINDVENSQ